MITVREGSCETGQYFYLFWVVGVITIVVKAMLDVGCWMLDFFGKKMDGVVCCTRMISHFRFQVISTSSAH